MNKQKYHRPTSTSEQKRQAVKVALVAVAALIAMLLLFNPWNTHTSSTNTASSSNSTSSSSSMSKGQSDDGEESARTQSDEITSKDATSLEDKAQSMFTGDAPSIANEVRDLLNAPEDSNVDSLSNLLYRHEHQDLAEASDVYDAIGREQPIDTIRRLAREWYPKAMRAAIEARTADIASSLDGAKRAADGIAKLNTVGLAQECADVSGAYERARQLVDGELADYDALTQALQDLTSSMSGCATQLNETDRASVFGQPQGSTRTETEE